MRDTPPEGSAPSSPDSERRRLDAWKEIARYLGRDVTTVRRWERREGLPVHRHLHQKQGSVYAYTDEIDAWWRKRSTELSPSRAPADHPAPQPVEAEQRHASPPARFTARKLILAVVTIAVVIVSSLSSPRAPRAQTRQPAPPRVALSPPADVLVETLVISPDGEQVAFSSASPDARLWIRRLDRTTSQPIEGTEGATFPFWSPDSKRLGFFASGWLKRLEISTREIRDLARAPEGRGGTWSEQGIILFSPDRQAALWRVPDTGGAPVPVTTVRAGFKEGHAWPEFLPDGRHFLYTDDSGDARRFGIWGGDLETGATRRVLAVYSSATYSRDGFLLYAKDELLAQRFDPERLELSGTPTPVADRVLVRYGFSHRADVSVSHAGVIAVRGYTDERTRLAWVDRDTGREIDVTGSPAFYSNPTLSPDDSRLVVTASQDFSETNLWLFDLANGIGSHLTFGRADFAPVWSANGDEIVYASSGSKSPGLYKTLVAGGSAPELVLPAKMMQFPESWSRDARYMTFQTARAKTKFDVWVWERGAVPETRPIFESPANEGQSRLSPNGRFLAYVSDESGVFEVYVRSFPSLADVWQISTGGGFDPQWRDDGGELFFVAADRKMMAVQVQPQPPFRRGVARPLFDTHLEYLWQDTRNHYDVTRDGRRFLVLEPNVDQRSEPFTIVMKPQSNSTR